MNSIDNLQIQSSIRRAGLQIPEALRGDKPGQIKRTGLPIIGDSFGSTLFTQAAE
jgi:hypothetical protein